MTIKIYSKVGCPYCVKAKSFLSDLNITYNEIVLDPLNGNYTSDRDYIFNTFGHKSFPIIFVGDTLLGGYLDLVRSYDTLLLHSLCSKYNIHIPFDF